jgi:hypothetical protein
MFPISQVRTAAMLVLLIEKNKKLVKIGLPQMTRCPYRQFNQKEQSPFWKAIDAQLIKKFPVFVEPEGSLPYPQELYLEPEY